MFRPDIDISSMDSLRRIGRHGRRINTGKNMAGKSGMERSGSMMMGMVKDTIRDMAEASKAAAIRI